MSAAMTLGEDRTMDRAKMVGWLRKKGPGLLLDVVVNFAMPVIVYDRLEAPAGEVPALLASSVPPLLWAIGGFVRKRRVDALSVIAMAGIALSVLAFFGGGSAQFLQLREKMVTLLIGLAFLGSAAIGKPLIYPLARATVARESVEALADFEAKRDDAMLRYTIMVMTLVWGFGLVADFAVSAVLIYILPVHDYLIVAPILGYGTMGGLAFWTVAYRRYRTRHVAMTRRQAEKTDGAL